MAITDLRQLETFRTLARTSSFTATAAQMSVTQSAISHSIKNLETSLNRTLITRGRNQLSLTPAGEQLLQHATEILARVESAVTAITKADQWGSGRLRIGTQNQLSGHLLPEALLEMRSCFPDASFDLLSGSTENLLNKLHLGDLDIVLGVLWPELIDSQKHKVLPLFQDELCLILPPEHPSLRGDSFDWSRERSVVLLKSGTHEERFVNDYLRHLSIDIPVKHLANDERALKGLVTVGMGIGFAPRWLVKDEISRGELVAVTAPGGAIHRSWGIFTPTHNTASILQTTLAGLLQHSANLLSRDS